MHLFLGTLINEDGKCLKVDFTVGGPDDENGMNQLNKHWEMIKMILKSCILFDYACPFVLMNLQFIFMQVFFVICTINFTSKNIYWQAKSKNKAWVHLSFDLIALNSLPLQTMLFKKL